MKNITKEFNYKLGNVITMAIFLLKIKKVFVPYLNMFSSINFRYNVLDMYGVSMVLLCKTMFCCIKHYCLDENK